MKSKGFTLLEITVVVSIIIIFFGFIFANYRGGEKQFALKRSAHKLFQDIRTVQEKAMSAKTVDTAFSYSEKSFPKGGYGIYMEKGWDHYTVFADCDGDGEYDESGTASNCASAVSDSGSSIYEAIETIYFEEGVYIHEFIPNSNNLYFTFLPPDPIVQINAELNAEPVEIVLTFNEGENIKIIEINSAGLIFLKQ